MSADEISKLSLEELRKKKSARYVLIKDWKDAGKDTTELEAEYELIKERYGFLKLCNKLGTAHKDSLPTSKNSYYYRLNIEWDDISEAVVRNISEFATKMGLIELDKNTSKLSYEFKGNDDEFKILKRALSVILDVSYGSDFKIAVYGGKRLAKI